MLVDIWDDLTLSAEECRPLKFDEMSEEKVCRVEEIFKLCLTISRLYYFAETYVKWSRGWKIKRQTSVRKRNYPEHFYCNISLRKVLPVLSSNLYKGGGRVYLKEASGTSENKIPARYQRQDRKGLPGGSRTSMENEKAAMVQENE